MVHATTKKQILEAKMTFKMENKALAVHNPEAAAKMKSDK